MITILYFASIKEKLGFAKEAIELPPGVSNVNDLTVLLRARGDVWAEALRDGPKLKVAVNHSMVTSNASIANGDEIAFFPPVTGG
ncbi:MAG TPA: molybdopterin converting factor subunit 1 [Burkholderiales bacterium]|jgi:molybdopterin synthase sulfur carrier subunit|nr:molybdopterin converting factor subunit 1 [Burkholderiales bacterium]